MYISVKIGGVYFLCLVRPLGYAVGLGSTSSPVQPCSSSNRRLLESVSKSSAPASMKKPPLTPRLKMTVSRYTGCPYCPHSSRARELWLKLYGWELGGLNVVSSV